MTIELSFNVLNSPNDCDVLVLDEQGLLFEKQHAYPGQFSMPNGDSRVDFELTESDIKLIAEESQRYVANGNQCNLPTHHTEDVEANRGLVKKWYTKPDSKGRLGLFSLTEFRDAEAAKLAKTEQTSIYAPATTVDGTKKKYIRAVTHVALTGRPVIPGLDGFVAIAASLVTRKLIPTKGEAMLLKDLANTLGLKLSEDVVADETKASQAIVASFKTIQEEADAKVKASALELSEYKKLNPPKSDPIRVSKPQLDMLQENRELKLSQLVEKGNILPCVKKSLEAIFCGQAALTLSLSEGHDDNFKAIVEALKENDAIKLSESTGPQTLNLAALMDTERNPMMKKAKEAAAKAAS
jgi:hypothetical protein